MRDDSPGRGPEVLADELDVPGGAVLHGLRIKGWIVDEGQDGQYTPPAHALADGIRQAASCMSQLVHFELLYPDSFRSWDDESGRDRVMDCRLSPDDLGEVARALPPGLRSLCLSNGLSAKTLVMLNEGPCFSDLHSLSLWGNALRSNVATLFKVPMQLRQLDVSANPIGDRGVAGLLRSRHLAQLEVLCARRCGTTPAGVEAAQRASTLPRLRHLVVS
jgi:hypothetical protein